MHDPDSFVYYRLTFFWNVLSFKILSVKALQTTV